MTQLITLIKQLSPASHHLYCWYVVQGGYGNHFQQTKFLLQFRLGYVILGSDWLDYEFGRRPTKKLKKSSAVASRFMDTR